jgi:hypothetical protein
MLRHGLLVFAASTAQLAAEIYQIMLTSADVAAKATFDLSITGGVLAEPCSSLQSSKTRCNQHGLGTFSKHRSCDHDADMECGPGGLAQISRATVRPRTLYPATSMTKFRSGLLFKPFTRCAYRLPKPTALNFGIGRVVGLKRSAS